MMQVAQHVAATYLRFATRLLPALLVVATCRIGSAEQPIRWLLEYDGGTLPTASTWSPVGRPKTEIVDGALRLVDDSDKAAGGYRGEFACADDDELVVEAIVKFESMAATRGSASSVWPWRDGLPVGLQICDGRRQEGLVFTATNVRYFSDRFVKMDPASRFRTYRLTIFGTTMSLDIDGERVIEGRDAFWKPADGVKPFLVFGSTTEKFSGAALWKSVKLGTRKRVAAVEPPKLKITIGEPWDITRTDGVRQTRPYLFNMGKGLLLMSVAQGPDALYEPYGILKSTDAGKTWSPIPGLDQVEFAPLPMVRRPDGSILGASRWCRLRDDGTLVGHTVKLNSDATEFEKYENRILIDEPYFPNKPGQVLIFERQLFNDDDGHATCVVWSRYTDEKRYTWRHGHLMKTTDEGRTWQHVVKMLEGGEPGTARTSATEMTAVSRIGPWCRMHQAFSTDGGKTWGEERELEEGSVDPDLEMMSNGVLACSYGRPTSCIMFSLDKGRTWIEHRVVSDRANFNYTSVREISPGRLLYVNDAPRLQGVYIDVTRLDETVEK